MKYFFSLIILCCLQISTYAQETYSISGTIKNQKGEALASATVFIAGSEKAVASDAEGKFKFGGLTPGTYQLVVNMLGYESAKQNLILKNGSESVSMVLKPKTIMLNDVNIGNKSNRKKYIEIFTKSFMGETPNVKYCKILNPDLLEFSTAKGTLMATTSDFLIIENNALGYRIKYLLKTFSHQETQDLTYYDGDYTFEQLKGTPEQQQKWEKARQETYEVSLMHYLRALYAGTTRQEGFLVYKIVNPILPIIVENIPIPAEQVIKRADSSLITFRYDMRFYILYDKKQAAKPDPTRIDTDELFNLGRYGSIFNTDARVDSRGSMTDYKKLLIQGFWGTRRVADQLPFEYVPPVVASK